MTPTRRIAISVGTLVAVTAAGAAGYMAIADMAPLDALYMTVITLATVGYGEVRPLTPAGRIFTMALIFVGMGTAVYTLGALGQFLIEGELREILGKRAMKRSIDSLRDHVIVCGYGRFGRIVADELERATAPFVVVEKNEASRGQLEAGGRLHAIGSALDEDLLDRVGVKRARAIVLGLPRESDNVFIALSVREANPSIAIHARAETDSGVRRLRAAGARQVVSPETLAGQRVGYALVRPTVLDFIELSTPGTGADVDLEEVVVAAGRGGDIALRDLAHHNVRVAIVAIKRGDEPPRLSPSADDVLRAGDRVVAVGDRDNLQRLAALVAGAA